MHPQAVGRSPTFLAHNHRGEVMYAIMLPDSIADRYTSIRPFPRGQHGSCYPVRVVYEVKALGVQHFALCDVRGHVVREFVSSAGATAFEHACLLADDLGQPWQVSGGSELFDPATRSCWSHKTVFDIESASAGLLH